MTIESREDEIGYSLVDPYPHYAELREQAPVHALADGTYLLTRYDDVLAAIRDHKVFSSRGARDGDGDGGGAVCLGAHLARLEARVAYESLVQRVRDLRHDGPVVRQLRGIRSMPVAFTEA